MSSERDKWQPVGTAAEARPEGAWQKCQKIWCHNLSGLISNNSAFEVEDEPKSVCIVVEF